MENFLKIKKTDMGKKNIVMALYIKENLKMD